MSDQLKAVYVSFLDGSIEFRKKKPQGCPILDWLLRNYEVVLRR